MLFLLVCDLPSHQLHELSSKSTVSPSVVSKSSSITSLTCQTSPPSVPMPVCCIYDAVVLMVGMYLSE